MSPTKELAHGIETLEWLLKIAPNAAWQVQIASLAHDIERAVPFVEGKYPPTPIKNDFPTYDDYKQAHALRSAKIIESIMGEQDFADKDVIRVCSAIMNHEIGGTDDSDLVRDADSIRWFDKGYSGYIEKRGIESANEKGWWMYKRATKATRDLINTLDFDTRISDYIKIKFENLPYRQGVYAYIINDNPELLLVHKRNSNMWDFPGGGVDGNETFTEALQRELLEELGITNFEILFESKITNKYDWPETEKEKNFKKSGTWKRGQEQHFFVIHIGGNVSMKLQKDELTEYKWTPYNAISQNMSYKDQFEHVTKVFKEYGINLPTQV